MMSQDFVRKVVPGRLHEEKTRITAAFRFASSLKLSSRAESISRCSEHIKVYRRISDGDVYMHSLHCRDRACPHCQRYLASAHRQKLIESLNRVSDDLVFMTLTVPNVKLLVLGDELKKMAVAYKKLFQIAFFKKAFKGLYASKEVTFSKGYHPHFHIVGERTGNNLLPYFLKILRKHSDFFDFCLSEYMANAGILGARFNSEKQKIFDSLSRGYVPQVVLSMFCRLYGFGSVCDIRRFDKERGVFEVSKYLVKGFDVPTDDLPIFYQQVEGVRLHCSSGTLRTKPVDESKDDFDLSEYKEIGSLNEVCHQVLNGYEVPEFYHDILGHALDKGYISVVPTDIVLLKKWEQLEEVYDGIACKVQG